ncbi:MAG: hypothetical protein ACRDMX_12645 [Solirubrobacteraceae bacterium]
MNDVWQSVKIAEFERVMADPFTVLLRFAGRTRRRRGGDGPRPALLVGDGPHASRFEALPAPPDRRGLLRAAYSVPAAAVTPGTSFALELPDGTTIELPAPVEGTPRIASPLAPATSEHAHAEAALIADAERAVADAERRAADGQRRAIEAEQRAADAERLAAESEQRASEAEGSIERRVAEGRAQARAEADTRAAEAAATLRGRLSELEQSDRLHEAEARALTLEVEALRHARVASERELRDSLDSLRKMTFERDELSRQAEAFDGVATKARERAGQAEAAHEKATARLNELEIWRSELERRLAATTSELGAARERLKESERDLAVLRDARSRTASAPPAPAPSASSVDLDLVSRRAEAEAARQAAEELARAAERARSRP